MKKKNFWRKLKNTVAAGLLVSTTGSSGIGMVCEACAVVGGVGLGANYIGQAINTTGDALNGAVPGSTP